MGDNNDGVIALMVGLVYILTATMAYKGGQMHAEALLAAYKAELPAQMATLCQQCAGLR